MPTGRSTSHSHGTVSRSRAVLLSESLFLTAVALESHWSRTGVALESHWSRTTVVVFASQTSSWRALEFRTHTPTGSYETAPKPNGGPSLRWRKVVKSCEKLCENKFSHSKRTLSRRILSGEIVKFANAMIKLNWIARVSGRIGFAIAVSCSHTPL